MTVKEIIQNVKSILKNSDEKNATLRSVSNVIFKVNDDVQRIHMLINKLTSTQDMEDRILSQKYLIDILAFRNEFQRNEIIDNYYGTYSQSLIDALRALTNDNRFIKYLAWFLMNRNYYYAECLYRSFHDWVIDDESIIDILLLQTSIGNCSLDILIPLYKKIYNRTLDQEIDEYIIDWQSRKILKTCLKFSTKESSRKKSLEFLAKKMISVTDNKLFNWYFIELFEQCQSINEVKYLCDYYRTHKGIDFGIATNLNLPVNSYSTLLLYVINIVCDWRIFVCRQIINNYLTKGNDNQLIRIIISHCEKELRVIMVRLKDSFRVYLYKILRTGKQYINELHLEGVFLLALSGDVDWQKKFL
ncbi:hypothetical protein SNEBB_004201 [Seison nebaliae]|nr:hypothetical protein SNEBB_004201 [Seison nebaliae]